MRRILLSSQKGGTSKTTAATCLAVGLARRGSRVLLCDLDGQHNASWILTRGQGTAGPTIGDVLMRSAAVDEAVIPTTVPGLELLPADASLSGVAVALVQEIGRDTRLRSAMAPFRDRWDYVICDSAPAFSPLLANAMVFSSEVIAPVDCGVFSLLGLAELQATITEVADAYQTDTRLAGILITKVAKNRVCADIEAQLRERFGPLVFSATIPASVKFEEASSRGLTILEHAPKSPGGVAYESLVSEVIERGNGTKERGGSAGKRGARKDHAA